MSPSPEPFNPSREETEKFTVLDQYLTTLDSYDRLTAEASRHGAQVAGFTASGGEKSRDCRVDGPGSQKYMNQRDVFQKMVRTKGIHSLTPWQPRKVRSITDIVDTQNYPPTRVQVPLVNWIMSEDRPVRRSASTRKICPGTTKKSWHNSQATPAQKNHAKFSYSLETTSQQSRDQSQLPTAPRGSPMSEWESITKGKAVNLDIVLSHSTMLLQSRRMLDTWDQLRLALDSQNLSSMFIPVESGHQPGTQSSKPHHLSSLIDQSNSKSMVTTSIESSPPRLLKPITKSSYMTLQSDPKLEVDKMCYSPTGINFNTYTQPSSCLIELNPNLVVVTYYSEDAPNLMSANSSILQTVAPIIHHLQLLPCLLKM